MERESYWELTINTQRLILRPQQPIDYEQWYAGFMGRSPSQRQYDDGFVSLDHCDRQWFDNLCQRHQQEAVTKTQGKRVFNPIRLANDLESL